MNIMQEQRQKAKTIQEHISRAKGYLRRSEFAKSMESAMEAFRLKKGARFIGKDKIETQYALEEYCLEFNAHPGILDYLDGIKVKVRPFLVYGPGKEELVTKRLDILRQRYLMGEEQQQRKAEEEREQRKLSLLGTGREHFESRKFPMGRSYLRKAVDEFGDDPQLLLDVGRLFIKYDFAADALEVLEDMIQRFPRKAEAYSLAAQAFRMERKYEDAEAVYQAALRQFGAHPRTLLNMSKMYLEWRKRDQAFEAARKALEGDSSLEEAKEIMDKTA